MPPLRNTTVNFKAGSEGRSWVLLVPYMIQDGAQALQATGEGYPKAKPWASRQPIQQCVASTSDSAALCATYIIYRYLLRKYLSNQ